MILYSSMMRKRSSNRVDEIIKLFDSGLSLKEVSDVLGMKYQNIQRLFKTNNLKIEANRYKKIKTNDEFFKTIDNSDKAYILGFTAADGCVYDKFRFGYCISNTDSEIIEFIKLNISPTSYVKTIHNTKGALNRKPQVILRITSDKLVSDLSNFDIVPRKTYKDMFLPDIEDKLIWSYIRGYFDGDGCISYHGKNKNTRRVTIVNGNSTILIEIQKFLLKFEITAKIQLRKTCCNLCVYKQKDIKKLYDCMYEEGFCLARKKNRFNYGNTEEISTNNKVETP